MKLNFRETINQKTDRELETISKDYVFYSEEERLIALREMEVRGILTKQQSVEKRELESEFEKELFRADAKRVKFEDSDENSEHPTEDPPTITLRITPLNQIRSLSWLLFFVFVFVSMIIIVSQFADDNYLSKLPDRELSEKIIFFTFFAAFISFFFLSILHIHIDYLIRNRNEEYEIGDNMIIRRKNGIETYYSCEDISDIHLYQVDSMRIMRLPPWSDYHFVKILMKSGEVLYLTSLLYPSGLDEILDDYIRVSYLNETRWFPAT